MSRFGLGENDIGSMYQKKCIKSWIDAGFDPVSINYIGEEYTHSVRMVPVERDASSITGRPHVYVDDMLSVAEDLFGEGVVALTNADIILGMGSDLARQVQSLQPGEMVFSRRIDVVDPVHIDGSRWKYGFDFFAAHISDIKNVRTKMVFGAPWWDHAIPIIMNSLGYNIIQIDADIVHLRHKERWSWSVWEEMGLRFIDVVAGSERGVGGYSRIAERAIKNRTGHVLRDLRYSLWRRMPNNAPGELRRILSRVSEANLSFIDEVSRSAR